MALQSLPGELSPSRETSIKRLFDLGFVLLSVPLVLIPFLSIAICTKLTSPGRVLHWSKRVGRGNHLFLMPKFRTMREGTPQLATHLLTSPNEYLTPLGRVLRKTSLDELPQLFSILQGHLSVVGPRPALFNQDDLVALRTEVGLEQVTPGLTGWAQINGRDELSTRQKVAYDLEYMERRSIWFDCKIIVLTIFSAFTGRGVSH
jgi:O-antigen biosynthesis protein WbqP